MHYARLVPGLLLTLALFGCEAAFEPFEPSDKYFSLYGYLDPGADTQFVRVIPVRGRILPEDGPIDAALTTTELASARTDVWRDSLFRFPAGRTMHVFWSTRQPVVGAQYRFSVERSDGAASRATVTVPPPPPDPVVGPPVEFTLAIRKLIRWPEVFNAASVEMVYHVRDLVEGVQQAVVIDYTDAFEKLADHSRVVVDLSRDTTAVLAAFELPPRTPLSRLELNGLEVRVVKASEEWTFVASPIDIETLAIPTSFTNVEHGFGFIGAVVRAAYPWTIPPDEVNELGYTDGLSGSENVE